MSVPGTPPTPPPGGVSVCPRHPDRESYVRCQRCERPACPDCQRPAAVGFHCVDCVAEANRGVRAPRTTFGGAVRGRDTAVTKTVVVVCALMYLAQFVVDPRVYAYLVLSNQVSTYPWAFSAGNYWQPLTSAFLHAPTPIHVLFNMYALWLVGQYLEPLLGRARFAALYLLSALGGAAGATLLPMTAGVSTVGASGAVFGLFGALFVVNRHLGRQSGQVLALVAINFAIGVFVPGISWQAHLGGLVTGAAVAAVLARTRRSPRLVQVAGLGAAALVVVALLAYAVARFTL